MRYIVGRCYRIRDIIYLTRPIVFVVGFWVVFLRSHCNTPAVSSSLTLYRSALYPLERYRAIPDVIIIVSKLARALTSITKHVKNFPLGYDILPWCLYYEVLNMFDEHLLRRPTPQISSADLLCVISFFNSLFINYQRYEQDVWPPGSADTVCPRLPLMTQVQHFVSRIMKRPRRTRGVQTMPACDLDL